MRSSNQIAAVTELRETLESENFGKARHFVAEQVPRLLADPAERNKLGRETLPAELDAVRNVANFFEVMGSLVKLGIVDQALICDLWDGVVFRFWKHLEPIIMIRREVSDSGLWANFEYLAVLCEQSLANTQGDHYPRGMRRMAIDKRSLEAASAFAKRGPNSHRPRDPAG
jgi:hypothetical protein